MNHAVYSRVMSRGKDDASSAQTVRLHARFAFLDGAMVPEVRIAVSADGRIEAVERGCKADGSEMRLGAVVPGVPNLHSHSFQRAMAGLAETAGPQGDSFWSWRDAMYRFLERIGPEEVEAIACQLQVECLLHGFTSLVEFHYLHLDPAGRPYADPAELAERNLAASETTGIGLTLLPVLYQSGGFGNVPPTRGQRRFVLDHDGFARLVETLAARHLGRAVIGVAPHSLRAVGPDALTRARSVADALGQRAPIHIHAAEQIREVEQCVAWSGRRPVEWLLDEAELGPRWTLIHATHLTEPERLRLAASGAVAGLCPTTEANLGDGLFPFASFRQAGGRFGIGTDSHVGTSPVEELRWLDYGARLTSRLRNACGLAPGSSIGASLLQAALDGGAQASGQPVGRIEPGMRADLVALDLDHHCLVGRSGDALVDAWLFSGNANPVRHVMVDGRWVVRDGHHPAAGRAAERFRAVQRTLAA